MPPPMRGDYDDIIVIYAIYARHYAAVMPMMLPAFDVIDAAIVLPLIPFFMALRHIDDERRA